MGQKTARCIGGGRGSSARQPVWGRPTRSETRRSPVAGLGRGARIQAAHVGEGGRAAGGGRRVGKAPGDTTPRQAPTSARQGKMSIAVDRTLDVVNTKAGPLLWSAGLLVLGVAVAQTVQRLLKLRRERERMSSSLGTSTSLTSTNSGVRSDHSILFSELEAKLMSPLLLAAETSAEVDETRTMSVAELGDLEVTLRTLLSGMDAQLEELKYDVLEQGMIPEDVLDAMDAVHVAGVRHAVEELEEVDDGDGEAWQEFKLFEAYLDDQQRRSFRSLLYNRSVQLKLLHRVERQIEVKRQARVVADGENEKKEPVSRPGDALAPYEGEGRQFFYAAGATAPHALKKTRGEDAFYIDNVAMVVGVADGVGGWERLGVDSGAYSRELMANCEEVGAMGNASCAQILSKAFQRTEVEGSCTCLLAKYSATEGRLDVVSVGDCSMLVVRDGKVVFKTEVQEHAWNQPYQLSHPAFNLADTPEDALEFSFSVIPGDIVVLGSDGLWDNIWDTDVLEAIAASETMRGSFDGSDQWQNETQELAQRLLELAAAHSLDDAYASPFAQEREGELRQSETFLTRLIDGMGLGKPRAAALGGKIDDVTVLCAIIG